MKYIIKIFNLEKKQNSLYDFLSSDRPIIQNCSD